jgi:ATP-dependent DNA helicase RecQ
MSSPHTYSRALALLKEMLGPRAQFRAGQWEAIEAIVERRGRALVVQRTGWGKSLVYFLATKILRDQSCPQSEIQCTFSLIPSI